jgi:CubicO group peptidase (beta-lactamase class C family)
VHATTLFRIGSVTKGLTATAVLRLVADGKVTLDASVPTIAPEFHFTKDASWAPAITVRNLLNHTAGQDDYLIGDPGPTRQTDAELQRFFQEDWPSLGYVMFPAGRMYDYANPNFNVLGLVIEKASGRHYRDFMKDTVFAPLGMTRTVFLPDEIRADGDVADGTVSAADGSPQVVDAASFDSPAERACGFAVSSVLDLAKFVRFIVKGNDAVLPAALRTAMQSKQVDTKQFYDLDGYGFGVQVFDYHYDPTTKAFYQLHVVGHAGELEGFAANWTYVPSLDIGFVTLSNASGAQYPTSFATTLRTLATLPAPSPLPSRDTDPAVLAKLAGSYTDMNDSASGLGTIFVKNTAGSLSIEVPALSGQSYDGALNAVWPNNYTTTIEGFTDLATFILDDAGDPEYLRTRGFVARRTMTVTPATPNASPARRGLRVDERAPPSVRALLSLGR